ncbi:hypothetical protein AXG93_4295s1780 [Marchantia polymorpha subsp. ruderalis]|uniref:Uncharacterized protein n=1 Tax=Marchantia polymorpha subsp. ruderalis TaxID=1480154 RepID=A0A176WCX0_MARPO|nr:hypothetical protein AXG93_4295s1780 [Marchantia polymorpha subsp. ruderalis]
MHWKGVTRGTVQIKVLLVSVNGKGDKTWRQHSAARDRTNVRLASTIVNPNEFEALVHFRNGAPPLADGLQLAPAQGRVEPPGFCHRKMDVADAKAKIHVVRMVDTCHLSAPMGRFILPCQYGLELELGLGPRCGHFVSTSLSSGAQSSDDD